MSCRMSLSLVLMAFLMLPLATGCRKGNAIVVQQATFAPASEKIQTAEVTKLIMRGCMDAGWTPADIGDNTIEARIVVRGKHTVVVEIPYTQNSYKIVYKNSINMAYKISNSGEPVIHPNYNKWVMRLNEAIRKRLLDRVIG